MRGEGEAEGGGRGGGVRGEGEAEGGGRGGGVRGEGEAEGKEVIEVTCYGQHVVRLLDRCMTASKLNTLLPRCHPSITGATRAPQVPPEHHKCHPSTTGAT